ncbi:hypothetical protein JT130_01835 [Helicobacter pylori]|nr:hypothetical protein [Helicobacter pylori]
MRKQSNKLFSFLNGIKWRDLRLIMRDVYGLRQYLKLKDKNKRLFFAVMLNAKILMP